MTSLIQNVLDHPSTRTDHRNVYLILNAVIIFQKFRHLHEKTNHALFRTLQCYLEIIHHHQHLVQCHFCPFEYF